MDSKLYIYVGPTYTVTGHSQIFLVNEKKNIDPGKGHTKRKGMKKRVLSLKERIPDMLPRIPKLITNPTSKVPKYT